MRKPFVLRLCAVIAVALMVAPVIHGPVSAAPRRTAHKAEPFYLKDGDRVVFYGDSITDQRLYTTYIESYCVTRFPKQHFTFVHSGWGGDRVGGGGGGPIDLRLKRDVLVYKPTVVTICLGMNDGGYRAFDQSIFDTYVKGYRHILDTLKTELPGVRITLLTAPPYDDVTREPGFPGGYNATLRRYGEAVADLAKEYHYTLADTNAPLVEALVKAKATDAEVAGQIIKDRVHPGPGGHMVMAAAVLKAWNAPATVADIAIDAGRRRVASAVNSRVSRVRTTKDGFEFTHLDGALPWPLDRDPAKNKDMQAALGATDAETALDRFRLTITGLAAGKYALKVDGNEIMQVTGDALGAGLDLAAIPDLPSCRQAQEVLSLIRKHNDLHFRRWRVVQVPATKGGEAPTDSVKAQLDELDKQDAEAEKEAHDAAQPRPHVIEVLPVL